MCVAMCYRIYLLDMMAIKLPRGIDIPVRHEVMSKIFSSGGNKTRPRHVQERDVQDFMAEIMGHKISLRRDF